MLVLLSGCDAEKISGYYYSDGGDALRVKKNGEVLLSPLSKTKDDFEPLAYLEWNEKKEEANLVMSSQHPFLGSQLTFSEDLQFIEIKWKRIDGQAQIGPQCLLRMFI